MIHNQSLAGIMVTHDLRMCQFADKIIQMRDGRVHRIIENKQDIYDFANVLSRN
jgi:putative ABC transport system ATP-binding protein